MKTPALRAATAQAAAALCMHAQAAFDTSATASASAMNVGNVSNASNGSTNAATSADLGRWFASASASIGRLGAFATDGGCVDPTLFQQPCSGASSSAQFDDLLHVTGAGPDGTPVRIEFDWSVNGTVNGIGSWSLQSALALGNLATGVSGIGFADPNAPWVDAPLGGMKSLVIDTAIGANIPISGWISLGVDDVACAGGSQYCQASLGWSITADASHTAQVSATVLTPGLNVQLVGDSGHDYLAPVPEPSRAPLLVGGLAAIGALRWRQVRRRKA